MGVNMVTAHNTYDYYEEDSGAHVYVEEILLYPGSEDWNWHRHRFNLIQLFSKLDIVHFEEALPLCTHTVFNGNCVEMAYATWDARYNITVSLPHNDGIQRITAYPGKVVVTEL